MMAFLFETITQNTQQITIFACFAATIAWALLRVALA
jgi:hypothetical protein